MLSGKQKHALRGQAHGLKPVVTAGDAGISAGVLAELDHALEAHELVKVRLPATDRYARAELADQLCSGSGAELVQTLGRMAVLYRQRERGS